MSALSPHQVAQYAYDAGFRNGALVTAIAVADAESSLNPKAASPSGISLGLWQISRIHDESHPAALLNPTFNAKMAYRISNHGTDWNPWRVYTSGVYKRFLNVAKKAAQSIRSTQSISQKVDVNSHSFSAIGVNHKTYLMWTALKKWAIPYKYLGHGKFLINGKNAQGILYKNNSYLPLTAFPDIQSKTVNGIPNYTDSYQPEKSAQVQTKKATTHQTHSAAKTQSQTADTSVNVQVDGKTFAAIAHKNSTYLLWTVLQKWNIDNKYLGHGTFSIQGHTVQGIIYKGNTYIEWTAIPGIQVDKIKGEFHFTNKLKTSSKKS